jgi:hypothetical protein
MAEVVKHLHSKHEALSSNTSTTKKKNLLNCHNSFSSYNNPLM